MRLSKERTCCRIDQQGRHQRMESLVETWGGVVEDLPGESCVSSSSEDHRKQRRRVKTRRWGVLGMEGRGKRATCEEPKRYPSQSLQVAASQREQQTESP